jgi:aminopeptidase N
MVALLAMPAVASADPFFPHQGNQGYDVASYRLVLRYDPPTGKLSGTATIAATATEQLSGFHLDLRGLKVSSVTVDGAAATFTRNGQELIVTPASPIASGASFSTVVRYHGIPAFVTDADGSPDGWIPTDDGAFVAGEPQGAPTWFPTNDTPVDKATYTISMTVPDGVTAVGNGTLVRTSSAGGTTTFVWRESRPMASYLATITLGDFDISQPAGGSVPIYIAVDPREASAAASAMSKLPDILAYEESVLGRYPFETAGAIVDHNAGAGYALETQTKPVFDGAPDDETLAHELAHQWFGDSVSLTIWPDIWLNEGFATYVQWMWDEHAGHETVAQQFADGMAIPAANRFWCTPPNALPGPASLFSSPVYERGAMTLEAVHQQIGNKDFRRLLKRWATDHRYGNVTTADFEVLAEQISGQDLGALFDEWLTTPRKPGSSVDPC